MPRILILPPSPCTWVGRLCPPLHHCIPAPYTSAFRLLKPLHLCPLHFCTLAFSFVQLQIISLRTLYTTFLVKIKKLVYYFLYFSIFINSFFKIYICILYSISIFPWRFSSANSTARDSNRETNLLRQAGALTTFLRHTPR